MVGVPPNMTNMLEVGGHANVLLLELPLVPLLAPLPSLVSPIDLHSLERSSHTLHSTFSCPTIGHPMLGSSIAVAGVGPLLLPAGLPPLPPIPSLVQL